MRLRRLIAVIAAATLLTGCTSLSLNGSDILAPPRAAGSRAELQNLIEKDADGGYTLIYPGSGDYKSGIIWHDLDGDGDNEAVALFTDQNGSSKILFAQAAGRSYRSIGNLELSSANVSSLSFADLDADGADELILCCDSGSPVSKLSAFFVGDEVTRTEVAEGFSGYVTGDFDGNSTDDILLFIPANAEATATAVLTVYADGAFTEKSSCETDPDIEAYARLIRGEVSDGIYGAFADGVNSSGEYTTQLICYDPSTHALVNPLFVYAGYNKTPRSYKIFSYDADGDGVTEIPVCEPMIHGKDEELSQICAEVYWSRYDPEKLGLVTVSTAVLCDKMGFMLDIKQNKISKVTARCADRALMTLYSTDGDDEDPELGQPLLTVKYYDKGEFDSSLTAEAVLYESNSGVYTCVINEGAGFTYDEIKAGFTPTENI